MYENVSSVKARSSWLIGRPNFRRSSGSVEFAGVGWIVFDHVPDDGVHHPHFLGRVHTGPDPPVADEAARAHDAHDHLGGLTDSPRRIDLKKLGERQDLGAVAHDVALRQAGARELGRRRDPVEQKELLGRLHLGVLDPRRERARHLQVLAKVFRQLPRRRAVVVPDGAFLDEIREHLVGVTLAHRHCDAVRRRIDDLAHAVEKGDVEGRAGAEHVLHHWRLLRHNVGAAHVCGVRILAQRRLSRDADRVRCGAPEPTCAYWRSEVLGWMTGIEPATSGTTIRRSTTELHPPRRGWSNEECDVTAKRAATHPSR